MYAINIYIYIYIYIYIIYLFIYLCGPGSCHGGIVSTFEPDNPGSNLARFTVFNMITVSKLLIYRRLALQIHKIPVFILIANFVIM